MSTIFFCFSVQFNSLHNGTTVKIGHMIWNFLWRISVEKKNVNIAFYRPVTKLLKHGRIVRNLDIYQIFINYHNFTSIYHRNLIFVAYNAESLCLHFIREYYVPKVNKTLSNRWSNITETNKKIVYQIYFDFFFSNSYM